MRNWISSETLYSYGLSTILTVVGVHAPKLASAQHGTRHGQNAPAPAIMAADEAEAISCEEGLSSAETKARRELIRTYRKWNIKTPFNDGSVIIQVAMAAVMIRNPLAIQFLGTRLTNKELDSIGGSMNAMHEHYEIPVRYARDGSVYANDPRVRKVVGPESIQNLFNSFSDSAALRLKQRILSQYPRTRRFVLGQAPEWVYATDVWFPHESDLSNLKTAFKNYFDSPSRRDEVAILLRLANSIETVLDTKMRERGKEHRESMRKGNEDPSLKTLKQIFDVELEKQLQIDFADSPATAAALIEGGNG